MFGYNPEDFLKGAIERTETTTVGNDRKNSRTTGLEDHQLRKQQLVSSLFLHEELLMYTPAVGLVSNVAHVHSVPTREAVSERIVKHTTGMKYTP